MWSKRHCSKTLSWVMFNGQIVVLFNELLKYTINHLSMLCMHDCKLSLQPIASFTIKIFFFCLYNKTSHLEREMEFSLTSCTCHCKEEIKSNAKGGNGTQELFQADAQCSVNLLFFLFLSVTVSVSAFGAVVFECYDNWILFCCGKGSSMSNSFPWMRNLINSGEKLCDFQSECVSVP